MPLCHVGYISLYVSVLDYCLVFELGIAFRSFLCGKLVVTVPPCMTMLHDWKGFNDWQSFRCIVWRVVVFSVRKQLSLLQVLIITELHEKFPSVYIIRRLKPCSQESGAGRTRVPHETSSRLHAVVLLLCLVELRTRALFSLQVFQVEVCWHLALLPSVLYALSSLILLYRFIHISYFLEHPHLRGYFAVWGRNAFLTVQNSQCHILLCILKCFTGKKPEDS